MLEITKLVLILLSFQTYLSARKARIRKTCFVGFTNLMFFQKGPDHISKRVFSKFYDESRCKKKWFSSILQLNIIYGH
jgi:hypothetical protein